MRNKSTSEIDVINSIPTEINDFYNISKLMGESLILSIKNQNYKVVRISNVIGLGQPIEVAPLRASTSEILNLASIAAYSSDVIDYSN